ncbi:MAG TPA: nuclear transport factor 2 family protein [Novosphingobium sp.]|nr:nuclear transport factor 2 family protein [Novosphingobium sp.]
MTNLAYLADRLAIEDVVLRYAWASDTLDADLYLSVFAADARITLPNGTILAAGHDQIGATARTNQIRFLAPAGGLSVMRHLVANLAVDITGDAAVARYCVTTLGFDTQAAKPEIVSLARYVDRLARHGAGWLIAERTMHYDWGNDAMARQLAIGPHTPPQYRPAPRPSPEQGQ